MNIAAIAPPLIIVGATLSLAALAAAWSFLKWAGGVNSDRKIMKADINVLKADTKVLKADSGSMKADIKVLKADSKFFKKSFSKLEGKIDDLTQVVYGFQGKMEGMAQTVYGLQGKMEGMAQTVYGIQGTLKSFDGIGNANSERKLNEIGRKMSEEFGARAWAEAHVDDVWEQMADKHPYDIQMFCFNYITEDILTEDEFLRVKDIAYYNDMDMFNSLRVLGYELRDCVIERQEQIREQEQGQAPEQKQGHVRAVS